MERYNRSVITDSMQQAWLWPTVFSKVIPKELYLFLTSYNPIICNILPLDPCNYLKQLRAYFVRKGMTFIIHCEFMNRAILSCKEFLVTARQGIQVSPSAFLLTKHLCKLEIFVYHQKLLGLLTTIPILFTVTNIWTCSMSFCNDF